MEKKIPSLFLLTCCVFILLGLATVLIQGIGRTTEGLIVVAYSGFFLLVLILFLWRELVEKFSFQE